MERAEEVRWCWWLDRRCCSAMLQWTTTTTLFNKVCARDQSSSGRSLLSCIIHSGSSYIWFKYNACPTHTRSCCTRHSGISGTGLNWTVLDTRIHTHTRYAYNNRSDCMNCRYGGRLSFWLISSILIIFRGWGIWGWEWKEGGAGAVAAFGLKLLVMILVLLFVLFIVVLIWIEK